ncbi:MAG: hypothetical protein IIZ99_00175 [Turicibacter sp.]|nr:hypothetical protein [Turicibacter sp.]
MSLIEIDLEDYKDEVKYTFCNNNNCLLNHCGRTFEKRFKDYIEELERSLLFFNGKTDVSVEKIIEDLKEMAKSLI